MMKIKIGVTFAEINQSNAKSQVSIFKNYIFF